LTCIANDIGLERMFARQVEALAQKDDLALGISTSGVSANVLAALAAAREQGCRTAGLTGGDGGEMAAYCDVLITAPAETTPLIQQLHITLGHLWVDLVERELEESG
ncbi:MAG: SIS domain-containing protein, partial [Alphaproteobacteria bacterium]